MRWARAFDPERSPEWTMLTFTPLLFWVRILTAQGEASERRTVQRALQSKITRTQLRHFSRLTLQQWSHLALVQVKLGDSDQAVHSLQQALQLAQPGGFIRSIVDAGPELMPLLEELRGQGVATHYLEQLMTAFVENDLAEVPPSTAAQETATLLTKREKEILRLMQSGLGNAEIAQALVISPYTVKRHASNIYRKLDVKNRRQAVYKAEQAGILTRA